MSIDCVFMHAALEIMSGNLSLGLNSSLTCKSIIPVDVMEWMDSDGETLVNKVNTDNLSLTFEPVNISIHNSQFTCQANKNGSVIKTIVAKISGKGEQYYSFTITYYYTYLYCNSGKLFNDSTSNLEECTNNWRNFCY